MEKDDFDEFSEDDDFFDEDFYLLDKTASSKSKVFIVYDDDKKDDTEAINKVISEPDFNLTDFLSKISLVDTCKYVFTEDEDEDAIIRDFERIVSEVENSKNGKVRKYIRGNYTIHFIPNSYFFEMESKMDDGCINYNDRDNIAEKNQGLIFEVYNHFKPYKEDLLIGYTEGDIMSACNLGFTKALNSYSSHMNTKFSTYAVTIMNHECVDVIKRKKNKKYTLNSPLLSLNNPNPNDDGREMERNVEDLSYIGVEGEIEQIELKHLIDEVLATLKKEDEELIRYYYGLDRPELTQLELSKMFYCSQPLINYKIQDVQEKLKRKLERMSINSY